MGRKNVLICDGCGQEKDTDKAGQWLEVYIDTIEKGRGSQEEIIVDSWDCLKRVTQTKIDGQVPAV